MRSKRSEWPNCIVCQNIQWSPTRQIGDYRSKVPKTLLKAESQLVSEVERNGLPWRMWESQSRYSKLSRYKNWNQSINVLKRFEQRIGRYPCWHPKTSRWSNWIVSVKIFETVRMADCEVFGLGVRNQILVPECESLCLCVRNCLTCRISPRRSNCPKPKDRRNGRLQVRLAETVSG